MPPTKFLFLLLSFSTFTFFAKGGNQLDRKDYLAYEDRLGISFSELIHLENNNPELFHPIEKLDVAYPIYWIKTNASVLSGYQYLILSNYFDTVELYYPSAEQGYSLTGRMVDINDRTFSKGFYRNILPLKDSSETAYIRLVSNHAYSLFNRTLSNLEVVKASELTEQRERLIASTTLITGMEIIILIIHLVLISLRPSFTGVFYSLVIAIGIAFANVQNETVLEYFPLSAQSMHFAELLTNILLIYFYTSFTAFYLRAKQISKFANYFLLFPTFIILGGLSFIGSGTYFPIAATVHFLLFLGVMIFLVIKSHKLDANRSRIFALANLLPVFAAILIIAALNGVLSHSFLTTSAAFAGFLLRDLFFTLDLIKNHFQLQKGALVKQQEIEKLEKEKAELLKAEEIKTNFFNNVSHELRTPLTLLLSPLEGSINSGKVPKELEKDLNLSLKNGKYLLQLVNEMLDLAKLDNGELALTRQPTDVVQVIKDIREAFQQYAQEKKQTIFITNASDSITAMVDREKFEKIIINLLSNAIKYSNRTSNIYIEIYTQEDALIVEVRDQGRGISKPDRDKIFDRFFQSEKLRMESGTGIGLSIVKEFMTLHKGYVSCASNLGKGSTFSLSFPKAIPKSKPDSRDLIPPHSELDIEKQTLMLVEDHLDMRIYLKGKLTEFNVVEAADGEKAIAFLKNGLVPDLIISDYMMPIMDGYELATVLKQNEKWFNIPIIFLTAKTLSQDKMKALNLGVDDYIIKPFDLEELRIRIKNLMSFASERLKFAKENIPNLSLEVQQSFKKELDDYLLQNLADSKLSNSDLAYHFNLSERNLFRRVKLVTGRPPATYIREIRLQKARLLLESSVEMTVSKVAYQCGMDNLAYFSQAFKKRFGKLPSEMIGLTNDSETSQS